MHHWDYISIPCFVLCKVEMRDSQCQTRESLFHPTDCSVVPAAPGFTTFGYGSSEEETTQPPSSRPVRTIGTHHHHYHLGGSDPRALSVESTKSAPDVIITHWRWEPYRRRYPRRVGTPTTVGTQYPPSHILELEGDFGTDIFHSHGSVAPYPDSSLTFC